MEECTGHESNSEALGQCHGCGSHEQGDEERSLIVCGISYEGHEQERFKEENNSEYGLRKDPDDVFRRPAEKKTDDYVERAVENH